MQNLSNDPSIDIEAYRQMIQYGVLTEQQAYQIIEQEQKLHSGSNPPKQELNKPEHRREQPPSENDLMKKRSSQSTEAINAEEALPGNKTQKEIIRLLIQQEMFLADLRKSQQSQRVIEQKIRMHLQLRPTKSQEKSQEKVEQLKLVKINSAPVQSEFGQADQLDFLTAEEREQFYRNQVMVPSYQRESDQQKQNQVVPLKFTIERRQVPVQVQVQVPVPVSVSVPVKIPVPVIPVPISPTNLRRISPEKINNRIVGQETIFNFRPINIMPQNRPRPLLGMFSANPFTMIGRVPNRNRLTQIAELANAPRIKILKYFGMVDEILYQIDNGQLSRINWVLTAKNNIIKTVELILPDGQLKIEINSRQIYKIVSLRENKMLIIFDDPLRFFKKHAEIGWDRLPNLFASSLPQSQLLIYSLAFKRQALLIQVDSPNRTMGKIREVYRKSVEEINRNFNDAFVQLSLKQLSYEYTNQKFSRYFDDYTNYNPSKSWNIQFSLLSLLYNSNAIDLPSLMQLATLVKKVFNPFLIEQILKTVISLNTDSLQSELRQKKQLKDVFHKKLQQQKISKSKGPSQNTIRVPTIKLTPSGYIPAGWNYDLRSRLTRHFREYDHQFLKIQVADDDFRKSELYQCKDALKPNLENHLRQITLLENQYIPLGWTQSQLKSKSMWFTLKKSPSPNVRIIQRQHLIRFLGDFAKFEKNPALKAARMGQNLSNGQGVILNEVSYSCQPDDKAPGSQLMYTDGIGRISSDLVEKIQKQLQTKANIFQIRYRGCKGMLVINRQLGRNTIISRDSMSKFQCPDRDACKYLDILAENSFGPGFLNRQIIILLNANHISPQTFIEIQDEFIDNELKNKYLYENFGSTRAKSNSWKVNNGFLQLESIGQIMNKIIKIKPDLIASEPTLRGMLTEKHYQMFEKLLSKSQIKIEKSARLLGIIDEYGILGQYQVYCQIIKPDTENTEKLTLSGRAMLTKNPCMHQADIRVVNCISRQEAARRFRQKLGIGTENYFDELVNCVIFPKAGKYPLTAEISGSDLDGDEFYITWDERLIPRQMYKPNILDSIKTTERQWNGVGYDQMIKFFCEFIFNNELGRLANSHLIHADLLGVQCQICVRLCSQYSKALDYPKKGYEFHFDKAFAIKKYPHWMQKPEKQTYQSPSVLGKLYDRCKVKYDNFKQRVGDLAYEHYSFNRFNPQGYSDKEIKSAFAVIEDFQYDIDRIMRINQLERQWQVYGERGSRDKQRDSALYMRNSLQRKYFFRFFQGLDIEDPVDYYDMLRNEGIGLLQKVQNKLILWYQISNAWIQKRDRGNRKLADWVARLERLTGQKAEYIKTIALPWFCVPIVTYLIACQQYV